MILRTTTALLCLGTLLACSQSKPAEASSPAPQAATQSASAPARAAATAPANSAPALRVDADRAMQYTGEIVAFGPRYDGSRAIEKVRQYILTHLKGDQAEQDSFLAETPAGRLAMTNIIAKYPGKKDGIIVLASHYETNYNLRNINYVGANDGAATSALLLEIANQLRGRKLDGYSVWLVWDDGEESVSGQWSDEDSLYGTRHLAAKWQQDGTIKKIKALFVVDMIGDKELKVIRDDNSTPWLEDLVYQAASTYGFQSHFFVQHWPEEDDHIPFLKLGVPVSDFISLPYGYNDAYHHTVEDTLDKLSARSLKIAGDTLLETIRLVNQR
jgi:glutaminyl-peptide cyclotransferase